MYSPQSCAPDRRRTRTVQVGDVLIGSDHPITVQSMTNTPTVDVDATLRQIEELAALRCEVIRCAVPTRKAAQALREVKARSPLPLIADIHFDHNLALASIEAGADGVRINPGNMHNQDGLREVYRAARDAQIKIRIGVNGGSIRPRDGLEVRDDRRHEDLPQLMAREALSYCEVAEAEGFGNIVLSLKASDAPTTIAAYRLAADQCDYPFHVGVTAAGPPRDSIVRSAVGIGTLLAEGIGDTIRVSMTGPPHEEVRAAYAILEALALREPVGPQIISCPTCARCQIDLATLADEVAHRLEGMVEPVKVAVMGCVVNGPGEAAEADVGIAGGRDFGYLFRHGRKRRKVPANQLADALVAEVEDMVASQAQSEGRQE